MRGSHSAAVLPKIICTTAARLAGGLIPFRSSTRFSVITLAVRLAANVCRACWRSFGKSKPILGAPDRNGSIKATALFDCLYEQAADLKPRHIGIDTSADVFAGNENDRAQVRQFISLLRKLAIVANCSIVLLSHPSLTGISSGTGISGSTAWHNSARSRIYMTAPKLEQGEQPATDLRELQFKKSNYGPISNNIVLRYQSGLFLPEGGLSSLDKLAREQKAEETFLALLARFEREGRNVSDKLNSPTYGPALFCKERDANAMRKEDLAAAMRRLFETSKIHVGRHAPRLGLDRDGKKN